MALRPRANDIQFEEIPRSVAVLVCVGMVLGVIFAYRRYHLAGIMTLLVYISSLVTCQLVMKLVVTDFPYPCFLNAIHCGMIWVGSTLRLVARPVFGEETPAFAFWGQPKHYFRGICPVAFATAASVVAGNCALMYIGAGLNSLVSIFTPLITATLASCCGLRIVCVGWVGLMVAILGDTILVVGALQALASAGASMHTMIWGLGFSFFALFLRGARTVMQDRLMNPYKGDDEQKCLAPFEVLSLQYPAMMGISLVGMLFTEGMAPLSALSALPTQSQAMVALSGFLAVTLTMTGIFVIKILGAPASQIAGKLNVLVIVVLSSAFMGETLTLLEVVGAGTVVLGAAIFDVGQHRAKEDEKASANGASCESVSKERSLLELSPQLCQGDTPRELRVAP